MRIQQDTTTIDPSLWYYQVYASAKPCLLQTWYSLKRAICLAAPWLLGADSRAVTRAQLPFATSLGLLVSMHVNLPVVHHESTSAARWIDAGEAYDKLVVLLIGYSCTAACK